MLLWNKGLKWHVWQVLIAIDQLGNALLGGWADCTISARAYYNATVKGYWYAKALVKILDWFFGCLGDKNHCQESYQNELNRGHVSEAMRQ